MKLRITLDVDYKANGVSESTLKNMLEFGVQHGVGEGMLTGSTPAEVNCWKTKVERTDAPIKKVKLVIPSTCRTDDGKYNVQFDALAWFQQASPEEIVLLSECNFGGDYPTDEVAKFFSGEYPLKELFEHDQLVKCGFECHISKKAALKWLKVNRRKLFGKIGG